MSKLVDLTGMKFGRLTVLQLDEERSTPRHKYWICQCDCGNVKSILGDNLKKPEDKKGSCKSCGCLKREKAREERSKDLTGQRFGRLVAIKPRYDLDYKRKQGNGIMWECQCDCGNIHTVPIQQLTSGQTRSCGCLGYENMLEQGKKLGKWSSEHKGELSATWKPNLTDEQRKENESRMKDKEWVACAKRTKKRDNYTCQCCGGKSHGNIISHHKNGWDNFKEQRYDDNNVITLCEDCHKEFHHIYGYGNNTEEQYNEFINNKDNTEVTHEIKVS